MLDTRYGHVRPEKFQFKGIGFLKHLSLIQWRSKGGPGGPRAPGGTSLNKNEFLKGV